MEEQPSRSNTSGIDSVVQEMLLSVPLVGLKRDSLHYVEPGMDVNIDDLPYVIYACFVLHNFCEVNKEFVSDDRVRSSLIYDRYFQPDTANNR